MKILLTGHISFILMEQFYSLLTAVLPEADIAVYGANKSGKALTEEERACFKTILEAPSIAPSQVKKQLWRGEWWSHAPVRRAFFRHLLKGQPKKAYQSLYRLQEQLEKDKQLKETFAKFDIVNIHYAAPGFLKQLDYVHENQQVVVSFWGSDLYQLTGIENYQAQWQALQRANAITLHSIEMEQLLLAKFGRELAPKVQRVIFGCHSKRFDTIDTLQQQPDKIAAFKNKWGLQTHKSIVQIGYSGGVGHRHIAVLNYLAKHALHLKDELLLLIPTTYANHDKDYLEQLKQVIRDSPFECVHLTEYLTNEEVLLLPIIVDVHVNVRDADALNNAMMEAFYAGCLLLLGCWLPYGLLRRNNFYYKEIAEWQDIVLALEQYLEQPKKEQLVKNKALIRTHIAMERNIEHWAAMYRQLADS